MGERVKITYKTTKTTQTQYYLDYLIEHCILAVTFFLPLSMTISSGFLGCGAVLWLGKILVTGRLNFKRTPFDLGIAVFVVLAAASIWGSPDRGFSFYNYYHLMGRYVLIYYLVVNNINSIDQIKRIVWVMLSSALVVSVYGFYQYLFGVNILAREWVDGAQFPGLTVRVFSTLENPNLLAGFLVTMMAIAGGMGCKASSVKERSILFSLVVVFGSCLILTYSRGAWLSLLAVIAVYGILCNRKIFWLFILLPIAMVVGHDAVLERIMSILNPTDTSSTLRLALWESTWAMIMDKPIFGIGWGAYWLVYPEYDFFLNNVTIKIFHAHNMYLNIAAEIGIPGLVAFLSIMYGHIRLALSVIKEADEYWCSGLILGIIAAITGMIINGFTDYVMFNIQLSMLYWFLNGLIVILWQQGHQRQTQTYFLKDRM